MVLTALGAGLLDSGTSLLGGAMDFLGDRYAMKKQMQMFYDDLNWQKKSFYESQDFTREQMDWQEKMSDPSYQASRLRAAGFNPYVQMAGGASSSPTPNAGPSGSGSVGIPSLPDFNQGSYISGLSDKIVGSVSALSQNRVNDAQAKAILDDNQRSASLFPASKESAELSNRSARVQVEVAEATQQTQVALAKSTLLNMNLQNANLFTDALIKNKQLEWLDSEKMAAINLQVQQFLTEKEETRKRMIEANVSQKVLDNWERDFDARISMMTSATCLNYAQASLANSQSDLNSVELEINQSIAPGIILANKAANRLSQFKSDTEYNFLSSKSDVKGLNKYYRGLGFDYSKSRDESRKAHNDANPWLGLVSGGLGGAAAGGAAGAASGLIKAAIPK
ncbi:DNA pilot protein [Dipodfec virus UA06Rod_3]|uniref:DNA pilot protein n=1 Tax=Dipodfec virus UA06Rod_3 TaxID=2929323 RepID=A0A976N213_9VIRU|nr:DNA pilot protein [Dipodfec virus UA06Rod_3]